MDIYDNMTNEELEAEFSSEKSRLRAKRRKNTIKKSVRKSGISKDINGAEMYDNLHQYSKGSCKQHQPNQNVRSAQERKFAEKTADMMKEYRKGTLVTA